MADGIKTRRELVYRALDALNVTAAGQTPSAEDYALMDGYVEPALAMLLAREIIDQTDPDVVPDELFLPLGVLVGDAASADFGINRGLDTDPQSWAFKVAQAEAQIRMMRRSRPSYAPAQPDYF
jgi:hypothetical protein